VSALCYNTTGYCNSAMGLSALCYNTTGYCNSAMGVNAGGYISGGGENQTPDNSIFLGYNTRAGSSGETNQIVIGCSAIGAGSNSVVLGNDSIIKTLLKGNVGIGTTEFGTNAVKVLGIGNCTKPTSFPADIFQMGSFDQAAGNACPHFWTELGKEIKLYQQAHIVDADGTLADVTNKLNALLVVLENCGFLAST